MAVRLGELLLREKRVTPAQLQEALNHQRQHGGRLSTSLVKLNILTDDDITTVVSRHCGVPAINLARLRSRPRPIVRLVSAESATKYNVLPVGRSGTTLTLAMADPTNVFAMDDIKFMTGLHVEPVVASESAIREAIAKRYYGAKAEKPAVEREGVGPGQRVRSRSSARTTTTSRSSPTPRRSTRRRSRSRAAKRRSSSWSTR